MKKSLSTDTEKHGRWLPWTTGTLAFAGLTGTLFALSEILENDSDGDGIADYLEFLDGTDPLDPNDPPQAKITKIRARGLATMG